MRPKASTRPRWLPAISAMRAATAPSQRGWLRMEGARAAAAPVVLEVLRVEEADGDCQPHAERQGLEGRGQAPRKGEGDGVVGVCLGRPPEDVSWDLVVQDYQRDSFVDGSRLEV